MWKIIIVFIFILSCSNRKYICEYEVYSGGVVIDKKIIKVFGMKCQGSRDGDSVYYKLIKEAKINIE